MERVRLASELGSEAAAITRLLSEADALRTRADEQQRAIAHLSAATKTVEELAAEISTAESHLLDVEHKRSRLMDAQQQLQHEIVSVRCWQGALMIAFSRHTCPLLSWSAASRIAATRYAALRQRRSARRGARPKACTQLGSSQPNHSVSNVSGWS
jgi:chromosome segregation ATPase